jgi:hypothetical protein
MSSNNIKPCKACGKEVSKSAATCPHCGQKLKMGLLAKLAIGLAGLIVVGMLLPKTESAVDKSADQAQSENVTSETDALPTYTAMEIGKAYDANTVAADAKFKDKRFKVTGVVTDINTDLMGDPYIEMEGSDEFSSPQFAFDKDSAGALANLQKGSRVTVVCTGQGDIAKTPMSDSCQLLPPEAENKQANAVAAPPAQESVVEATSTAAPVSDNTESSTCVQGTDGAPAFGSDYEDGIYLCREPVESYWNDWYAVLPSSGQTELQIKSEGKTSGFSGNLTIDCESGQTSWSDASNFDEPLGSENEISDLVPSQVMVYAKRQACKAAA